MTWETIISNVGFPIAMCIYLIIRTEKIINKNTDAINKLIVVVEKKT
jgi:hypothetical protein